MKNKEFNEKLRNIAIIAHVDHGKTTLVDAMFQQSGLFRENQVVEERLMDNMDLERERGITIEAKNCAVGWKGTKINIIDTPGHADFGGEVERALSMADGALLLVDAAEGPLPQTRFVLGKALESGMDIIVVINKIDRGDARCDEVHDEILNLLIDLGADDDQLDFPLFYAIGRDGIAKKSLDEESDNLHYLLDAIVEEIPGPCYDKTKPLQILISDLNYSEYLGRLAIGKIHNGIVRHNDSLVCIGEDGKNIPLRISKLQVYDGTTYKEVESADPGEIVILSGIDNVHIGDTVCTATDAVALKRIVVDEPTVSMRFMQNTSPYAGKEGKLVQSSRIRERLMKETLRNVALKIEETDEKDNFIVKGRGEFQLAILIEQMRREGFELCVGRPKVIYKKENGKTTEPMEHLSIDCEEAYTGVVVDKLSIRKGKMVNLVNHGTGRVKIEFIIPSRALIGYRDEFLTDTKGTGLLHSLFSGYEEYKGEFSARHTGSIIADRIGSAVAYALFHLEPRGRLLVRPGDLVYEGMIVGEHNKDRDITANVCKQKKLSNVRASGKDDTVMLVPVTPMSLEKALQFIGDDELVEVTPKSIRMRKIYLTENERKRNRPKTN